MPTDTLAALHRAVVIAPADTAARLVYADCLEDNGQWERAEFIRCQIEIEKINGRSSAGCSMLPDNTCSGFNNLMARMRGHEPAWCSSCLPKVQLLEREEELFFANRHIWGRDLPSLLGDATNELSIWRRGFVELVTCSLDAWQQHGAAVVAATPLTSVVLTDREPFGGPAWWGWTSSTSGPEDPAYLPHELLQCLPDGAVYDRWSAAYRTREEAVTALSPACLALARRRAGLDVSCPDCDGSGRTALGRVAPGKGRCVACGGGGWVVAPC